MDSPFGTSNQGGYRGPSTSTQQPAPQQNYGGFGGQQAFGGFQQQNYGGFNPMFGGIGGLGFNPMMGPQFMQPTPFFGGFGGGFGGYGGMPMGYGGFGGFNLYQQQPFNPMFGGIGGMGFNPMMGPQFMQPMQGYGGFNPYQQQNNFSQKAQQDTQQFDPNQNYNMPMDMMYRGGPQMTPEMRQRREQDMQMLESQARALLTGATGSSNPGMMALQQAALSNASPQELATPVENRYSLPSDNWWKTPDAETQYQQEQAIAQQQRAMNPGGRSMQDWQAQYNQMYNPNRMTMDVAPSLNEFIQRRTNPISFPGMPGFTL